MPADHLPEHTTKIEAESLAKKSSRLIVIRDSRLEESSTLTKYISGDALLVVKDKNSEFYVYFLPIWRGNVLMPNKYWGQHEGTCKIFEAVFPDDQEPKITCTEIESSPAPSLSAQWNWNLHGKNLGTDLPDLIKVGFRERGSQVHAFFR